MTVTTRSKIGAGRIRRYREGRLGRVAEHKQAPSFAPTGSTAANNVTAGHRRREAGVPEDQAMYNCSCGYVFAAQVSTNVGCPHCGDTQAW